MSGLAHLQNQEPESADALGPTAEAFLVPREGHLKSSISRTHPFLLPTLTPTPATCIQPQSLSTGHTVSAAHRPLLTHPPHPSSAFLPPPSQADRTTCPCPDRLLSLASAPLHIWLSLIPTPPHTPFLFSPISSEKLACRPQPALPSPLTDFFLVLQPEPQTGDLTEISRCCYSHWAVCVGDGYVVHVAPPRKIPGADGASIMSSVVDKAFVKKERLRAVVGGDTHRVNNKHDDKHNPFPPRKTIQPAEELVEELVDQEFCCSLIINYCEFIILEPLYTVPHSN
nr:Ca(2+)-independent N-acyltransferase-like [Odocoileus virginianus texanus]